MEYPFELIKEKDGYTFSFNHYTNVIAKQGWIAQWQINYFSSTQSQVRIPA